MRRQATTLAVLAPLLLASLPALPAFAAAAAPAATREAQLEDEQLPVLVSGAARTADFDGGLKPRLVSRETRHASSSFASNFWQSLWGAKAAGASPVSSDAARRTEQAPVQP